MGWWWRWRLRAAVRRVREARRDVWHLRGPLAAPGPGGFVGRVAAQAALERAGDEESMRLASVFRCGQMAAAELLMMAEANEARIRRRIGDS